MQKTIYIADIRSNCNHGQSTGHFVPLARMYQELFSNHCGVIVAGGPVYKQYFQDREILHLPYDVSGTSSRDKWHTMKNCIALFRAARGQTIVLQQSSAVTSFLGIALFYHRNSRLLMIQYSNSSIDSLIKRLLYRLAKRKIDGIICPNEEVGMAYGLPYCVVPDYIYVDKAVKPIIPYDQRKYDFCMVGRIAPEKGVVEAARWLKNKPYKVVIAGKPQTRDVQMELESICENADNIELHLGYIDETAYDHYICLSRFSILNYSGEYSVRSSGVVFDILFRDTPVIGHRCKALQFIEEKNLGIIYDSFDQVDFNEVISEQFHKERLQNIRKYKTAHEEYGQKLRTFVLTE